ncbi:TetR/AcrR family transcriptional regulator [Pseudomonas fragi]|jgi:TetR/AcrR family transcriptional repressor of nem operon|uniref:TetR/AcrR family transcriptional regulator n=1 Tax=Pseudomonas fragi TaxID=296 RepID=UPI0028EF7302|nr:TetR/AcrR family transcriptional regulator [Pseudomonas fragi]
MRYSSQHKAETRVRLLKSAAVVAKRSGLAAASVDRIATSAGITGGALYSHFPSKDELFASLVAQEIESCMLTRLTRTGDLTKERLLVGLKQYLSIDHSVNVEGGCPIPSLGTDISRANESVKQDFEAWLIELHHSWTETLGSSSEAWAVIAQCTGAILLARMLAGNDAKQKVLDGSYKSLASRLEGAFYKAEQLS